MFNRKSLRLMLILVCALILSSCSAEAEDTDENVTEQAESETTEAAIKPVSLKPFEEEENTETDIKQFVGNWNGFVETESMDKFDFVLDIHDNNGVPKLLVSSETFKEYFVPVEAVFEGGGFSFFLNEGENLGVFALKPSGTDKLAGTYTQHGQTTSVEFFLVSKYPKEGEYLTLNPNLNAEGRLRYLKEFAAFADDETNISYTYELNNRAPWEDIIAAQGLDALTEGKTDVELMKTLLFWVSENYKHGNPEEVPSRKREPIAIMEATKETDGYVNCRGLSLILSDLCRAYGIPAKQITCLPREPEFDDCHAVVLAYSEELNQWIMLDPTYKLILQDENGKYMDLAALRYALVNDEKTIPNEEYSYNGNEHSIEAYREYMIKNTFGFSTATNFYYGAEEGYSGNTKNMLVPVGYDLDSAEVTTTSETEFWKLPQGVILRIYVR